MVHHHSNSTQQPSEGDTMNQSSKSAQLKWCRIARIARAAEVKYFGTLAPQHTNDARTVKGLYR
jgi:hypothetical protein